MTKKQRALEICEILKQVFPEAPCQLNAETPFQLLVATRLSAQCTDARVNLVTPALFEKYPTENQLAEAELTDVEDIIHSCGFYHGKARDLVGMAKWTADGFEKVLYTHDAIPEEIKEKYNSDHIGGISYYNGKIYAATEDETDTYNLIANI